MDSEAIERAQQKAQDGQGPPAIKLIDIQARRVEDRTFIIVAQGVNMTEPQFLQLLANVKSVGAVGIARDLIDRPVLAALGQEQMVGMTTEGAPDADPGR